MNFVTLEDAADFMSTAMIEKTTDLGFAIIHIGLDAAGSKFALVNHYNGQAMLAVG